ncbi:hypothetical protein IP84_12725 [beta proteobacterium AAP99]|nr:hypothetical protein IP84_12725 [beta proteobacterium AAP99]
MHTAFGLTPQEATQLVNRITVGQHIDEATFLWVQRSQAVSAPNFQLSHLHEIDRRLLAHLHGILASGSAGKLMLRSSLEATQPGAVFVLAWTALRLGDADAFEHSLALSNLSPEYTEACIDALVWVPHSISSQIIDRLWRSQVARHRAIVVEARARLGQFDQAFAQEALADVDASIQSAAAVACGEYKLRRFLPQITQLSNSAESYLRQQALLASSMLGEPDCAPALWACSNSDARAPRKILEQSVRLGRTTWARGLVRDLASVPHTQRQAILAAAALGDAAAVPWLISLTEQPALAQVAGEAVAMVTGVDLTAMAIDDDAAPEEFEQDEALEVQDQSEDFGLPHPSTAKLHAWWTENAARFQSGQRYLSGRPIQHAACLDLLKFGYQRQRAAAAVEFARLNPDAPLFVLRAPAHIQRKRLGLCG